MHVVCLRKGMQSPHPKLKFTPQEDAHLITLVEEHGSSEWPRLAPFMPGRNAGQDK
jgi:hypothetical protein